MATFRDFALPRTAVVHPTRNFSLEFQNLCTAVNAVNHGEFEGAVDALVEQAGIDESCSTNRANSLAIQRCRRGGKTFMLHAIASLINNERGIRLAGETYVIFISLNKRDALQFRRGGQRGKGSLVFYIISNCMGTVRSTRYLY
jgi:hypothetical protein